MKICIVLNGEISDSDFFQQQIKKFDCIIAADGGANKCYELGIVPDYIIGDFDSVTENVLDYLRQQKTRVISAPSQNTLDFQEAIWLAETIFSGDDIEQGLDARRNKFLQDSAINKNSKLAENSKSLLITIFAGLSDSQIDHTMGNLLLGVSLPTYITLKFSNSNSDIFVTKQPLILDGEINDIVSAIPLQKTTALNYSNLLYPVENLDVDVGWLGSRNRMTGRQALIDFESGTLLVVRHKIN